MFCPIDCSSQCIIMPLPVKSLLLLLAIQPILGLKGEHGQLKFCPLEHVEIFGHNLAEIDLVENVTVCEDHCWNTPDCQIYSYRAVQRECVLMKELLAATKKNAWKVTSGALIDEVTDIKSMYFSTCEMGRGLPREVENALENLHCYYERDFFKCGVVSTSWPKRKLGCFVQAKSVTDCHVRKFRFLRKVWQYDFYGKTFEDSNSWQFMRDESCQINTDLDHLCSLDPYDIFVQTYSVVAHETVACRPTNDYGSHPSHFFKAAIYPDPMYIAARWPLHEVIRQPALWGIYPQFVYFCRSVVLPRRSLQASTNACGGMMQATGTVFPPDAKQPWPKVDTFRHCQEICQMFLKCKFVSYEFATRLCWMYSEVVQVYPNSNVISGPKQCSYEDAEKFYTVEDLLENWTGSSNYQKQGAKYEELLKIYAKEEDPEVGASCIGFEPPRWCKSLGGYEVSLFYSETMDCSYLHSDQQNCTVLAKPIKERKHLCAFCNVRNDAGIVQAVPIPSPDQCQLDCSDDQLTCRCDITALQWQ